MVIPTNYIFEYTLYRKKLKRVYIIFWCKVFCILIPVVTTVSLLLQGTIKSRIANSCGGIKYFCNDHTFPGWCIMSDFSSKTPENSVSLTKAVDDTSNHKLDKAKNKEKKRKPAASPVVPKKKILCLHGYLQSKEIFRDRTGSMRKALKSSTEFYFIDAPFDVIEEFKGIFIFLIYLGIFDIYCI